MEYSFSNGDKIIHVSICFWDDWNGGRPLDNVYTLTKIVTEKKFIKMYFDGNEECVIEKPEGIELKDFNFENNFVKLYIKKAASVSWKFYYYGKPQSQETLSQTTYTPTFGNRVKVVQKGCFTRNEVISSANKNAVLALLQISDKK